MPNPTYATSCPACGLELTPHAGHPDATPWACHACRRGWWVAELSAAARAIYRPLFHDWGFGPETDALRADVAEEAALARQRGTSARHEHLGLLADEHLAQVQRWVLNDEFAKHVKAARDTR